MDDCAIDPSTNWLSGNFAANTQIRIPVYMDMKGAIASNGIEDFMKNLMEINSWVEEFNNYGKDAESHYQKELLYLQYLLVKLGRFNLDDEGKKYQLNGEAIQYIILKVLYNIEQDIANEIDIDKVNFMHKLYTGFFWYRPYDERNFLKINPSGISNSKRLHFHFNFNDLRNIYEEYNKNQKDDNIDSFNNMQKIFLALNEFKKRTEINYRDYREVSKDVDDKVDLFSSIERYLLGVIEKNNSYNEGNYGNKKDKYAKLIYERNDLVDTKDQLIKENFELNNKDNKDKKDAARIKEIKEILKIIDGKIPNISEEILRLKNETERLEKEYEQENTLNDVVQNIRRWLKENENMVKAIKKIDTNNMANK